MARLRLALGPGFGGDGAVRCLHPKACLWWEKGQAWVQCLPGSPTPAGEPFAALEKMAAALQFPALGYLAYEAAPLLRPEVAVCPEPGPLPLFAWYFVDLGEAEELTPALVSSLPKPTPSLSPREFEEKVEAIRQAIGAGEVYQVNLTCRWETPFAGDPAGLFAALAQAPLPRFAFFLQDQELDLAVVGLSPELFLAKKGQHVESWPIKGTWRKWEEALAAGEKEQAELAMIVDLVRHDLGQVCQVGSVQVTHPWRLLEAGPVVHREAVVEGLLQPGVSLRHILAATFPGGSVTGAPKLAACRFIAQLEPVPRSVYCGAYGVFYPGGDFLLALPIRTGYGRGGKLYFHGGAGILWDSQASLEEAETRAKVAPWLTLGGA